jgi:Leucine-rich repeat (LRR) protein
MVSSLQLLVLDLTFNNISSIDITLPLSLTFLNLSFNQLSNYEETIKAIKPLLGL